MALSLASVGTLGNTKTGTTFTVGVPSGVTAGALVCVAVMGYAGSAPGTPTVTGFTLAQSSAAPLNAFGLQFKTWWFYKYASGADSGTYAGTCTSGNAIMAFAFRVAGWSGSGSPFVDSLHEAAASGAPVTVASFTPGGDNSLLALIMLDGGANYPPTWTEATNAKDLDGDTITLASLAQTTASATGAITGGNTDGTVLSVATLRQASSAPATAAGGIALAGSAAAVGQAIVLPGGIALGGTASGAAAAAGLASGGITLGGAATGIAPTAAAASGGITLGGTATGKASASATGGLTLGGTASGKGVGSASGGIILAGQAAGTFHPGAASGGLTLAGTATGRAVASAHGTITLGGYARADGGGTGSLMTETDFWAQASGLTPVDDYTPGEHKLAAMRNKLSITSGSLDDVQMQYFASKGFTGSVGEMTRAFWAGLAGLPVATTSLADARAAALALGPAVP